MDLQSQLARLPVKTAGTGVGEAGAVEAVGMEEGMHTVHKAGETIMEVKVVMGVAEIGVIKGVAMVRRAAIVVITRETPMGTKEHLVDTVHLMNMEIKQAEADTVPETIMAYNLLGTCILVGILMVVKQVVREEVMVAKPLGTAREAEEDLEDMAAIPLETCTLLEMHMVADKPVVVEVMVARPMVTAGEAEAVRDRKEVLATLTREGITVGVMRVLLVNMANQKLRKSSNVMKIVGILAITQGSTFLGFLWT